mmetsp:Transcript_2025/g.3103  ORF Transcript_2025/g.3103 Transcript_2025/m.3103 type:complete len:89 (-) Transcript_2025:422-688(-)
MSEIDTLQVQVDYLRSNTTATEKQVMELQNAATRKANGYREEILGGNQQFSKISGRERGIGSREAKPGGVFEAKRRYREKAQARNLSA